MAKKKPYAFITCLGTGAPWCEQAEDTTFDDFMTAAFGSSLAGAVPSEAQDAEFSCAHPTRNGSNSMTKKASACIDFDLQETPRVVFSLRGLWLPAGRDDIIRSSDLDRSGTKFWVAVRCEQAFTIPSTLGNDRKSPYRRHPSEIAGVLPDDLLKAIRTAVLDTEEVVRDSGAKRAKHESIRAWNCLRKLVIKVGIPVHIPAEGKSTSWKPAGETVYAPWDILVRKCSCACGVSFPAHMSVDCKGLGTSNVAQKTRYHNEREIIPAVLHAMKSMLL